MAIVGQTYTLLDQQFDLQREATEAALERALVHVKDQLATVVADRSAVISELHDLTRQTKRVVRGRDAAHFQLTCAQRKVQQLEAQVAALKASSH
jgi:hypothetical protein